MNQLNAASKALAKSVVDRIATYINQPEIEYIGYSCSHSGASRINQMVTLDFGPDETPNKPKTTIVITISEGCY